MLVKEFSELQAGLEAKFFYTPLPFGSVSSNRILSLIEKNAISRDDFQIMKYLYKFKCAPVSYIIRDVVPGRDTVSITKRLNSFVKQRLLNSYVLSSDPGQDYNDQGLVFYTVDYGAVAILRGKTDDETIENWKATDLLSLTGLKTKKQLMMIDFYNILKECDLKYFVENELYRSYEAKIRAKAVMKLGDKTLLVETTTADDFLEGNESHILEKLTRYENLLATEGWTYYFEELPTLLVLCDSKETVGTIAPQLQGSKIENIRYAYMDNGKVKLCKWEDGAVKAVRSKLFSKKED